METYRGIKIGKKQKGRVLWSEIKSKDADPEEFQEQIKCIDERMKAKTPNFLESWMDKKGDAYLITELILGQILRQYISVTPDYKLEFLQSLVI